MFEPFYGLAVDPFAPAPHPAFFFRSRAHLHACECLGVALQRPGVVVLAGDAGIGKSTTVQAFLPSLDPRFIIARTLHGERINMHGVLQCVGEAFGLLASLTGGRRLLPVVDEAHLLTRESLEELLPLQPLLVAQTPPDVPLGSICRLGPLEPDEVRGYVEQRLRQVGWKGEPRFDDDMCFTLHRHAGGNPQRINLLCRRAIQAV
jgi:type II secretory pathway predicted ATPase ExeA